ncbi:response regulator [Bradyrhizobium sp. 138]|nr:LuxR C-terminal-related transcriptional regulator [Bradyrhizobium sp. 138]MCK1735522.1 response regulator [Bradyrhizobium sp. 138]
MLDVSVKQGRIRLLIVDRQPIVLHGLKSVLGAQQDFDVVASCSDGTSCLEAIRNLTPDVALVADNLPDLTVPEILAIAKAENLSTRLVLFTESEAGHDLAAAIAAGACSVVSKHASSDAMLRLLRLMTTCSVSSEQSDLLPTGEGADGGGKVETMLELLTHRERQIVRLVSEGKSNKEIARQLNVSPGTVKVHLYNIFQKLEITNRTVLATLALLQRPSGFGTLALAFLVSAIADELKAAEANDVYLDDDSIGPAGEHAEYEPWKKAILRQLIVWESAETSRLIQRDFFAKVSQVTNPAVATEALGTAEQSAGSKPGKDCGSVGSSSPNLATPFLLGMNDRRIGGDLLPEHLLPRFTSNPTLIHAGYGTFATLTGALIYTLNDPHLAVQSHDPGKAPIDSFVVVTAENAATKLAAITDADTNHRDGSLPAFAPHDLRVPDALVITGSERVAGEGASSQISHGAADDSRQELHGWDSGHDARVGGEGRDQLMRGNVGENVVYRSATDSNSKSSHSGFEFASGSSRINLAAFGALAWLHMTAASKSIPPHTLAWIYNPATNETIVYVNPTDRILDVGDRGLLEIHLQGIVSLAESDFVGQPEGVAIAITLEQLEGALTSATATEAVLNADITRTVIGTSESALAEVWNILADDGLTFEFGQARTGSVGATRFRTFISHSAGTADESDDGSGGSAHVSPIVLAHSATVTAVENLTSKNEPINEGSGSSLAAGGNSQNASEPGSAKAAAELAEAGFIPGNGVGNDNEHHPPASDASRGSAKMAEAEGVEHGNSGHSTSANAPEGAKPGEPGVAKASVAGGGNSQNASEAGSAKAAAELAEAGFIPGNGVGSHDEHHPPPSDASRGSAKTAEAEGIQQGNSGHSTAANAPEAAEPAEPGLRGVSGGSSPHASEPRSAKAAAEPTGPSFISGDGAGNDNEHHPPSSGASRGTAKTVEADGAEQGNSGHPTSANAPEAAEIGDPSIATAGSVGRGDSRDVSEPGGPKAAATELTGAGFEPRNGVEHHARILDGAAALTAQESTVVEHGNSGHDSHWSEDAPEAAEPVEPGVAKGSNFGNGSPAAQSAATASETAQPAKIAFETGRAELAFRFDGYATPPTFGAAVEPNDPLGLHVSLGQEEALHIIGKLIPNALDEHAIAPVHNVPHHAIVPAPHDVLI